MSWHFSMCHWPSWQRRMISRPWSYQLSRPASQATTVIGQWHTREQISCLNPRSFAEDTGHCVNICLYLSSCFSTSWWAPKAVMFQHQFFITIQNQAMYNKPEECVKPFTWKKCMSYVLQISQNTVLLTITKAADGIWSTKNPPTTWRPAPSPTTANLPHPSEAYASAHCTSVRGNNNCRCISNNNSMYRSPLKSMTQYKSK